MRAAPAAPAPARLSAQDVAVPRDVAVPHAVEASESTTRQRVLRLVVGAGPVSVVELAEELGLTAAGVRRHVAALEDAGQVAVHTLGARGPAGRGRPARRYVATDTGRAALSDAYAGLAAQALALLAEVGGESAVEELAARRVQDLEVRLRQAVAATGADELGPAERVDALVAALTADGYAASARPVPGGRAVQLCQGHCPVRDVAAAFPQLCEAETRLFSRVLGVHVQRLSTLAAGGHVCTTHVPTTLPSLAQGGRPTDTGTTRSTTSERPAPAGPREGAR